MIDKTTEILALAIIVFGGVVLTVLPPLFGIMSRRLNKQRATERQDGTP